MRDPRSGRYLASVTSWFYGGRIWVADDPAGEWQEAEGIALPEDGDASLARIWVIAAGEADGTLYAGGDPGCLFESHDGGLTWALNRGLWEHPTRPDWKPGGGGLCLHTIVPVAGRPRPADGRDLRRRRLAHRRRRRDVALLEQRHRAASTCRRRRATRRSALRPQRPPRRARGPSASSCSSTAASTAPTTPARPGSTSATDRPAVRLRLPDRRRPGRPRQRLRDPADRRRGPDDARRLGARLGDARRRRDLGAARRRAARAATRT